MNVEKLRFSNFPLGKVSYIVALLMMVLIVGCAAPETTPETGAAVVPPPAPEAPVEEAPAEEAPAEAEAPAVSDASQAHIDRLKPACERGSLQSCLALKNLYGVDWPPAAAEETTE